MAESSKRSHGWGARVGYGRSVRGRRCVGRLATCVGLSAMLAAASLARAGDKKTTCVDCHAREATEFGRSVHGSLSCNDCHGGAAEYALSPDRLRSFEGTVTGQRGTFDHGTSFTGKPERKAIPDLCGSCHADVARINPYNIRTDQLARYWTSGHGKTLRDTGDDRVAVCIDCHGAHEIRSGKDGKSKTHPLNIPDTCGACHADYALMKSFSKPAGEVEEYRNSVHGRLLLEQHDTGAPTCATCHGNHSAAPPGFSSVRTVCGKCHVNAAEAFATTPHAGLEEFRGCVQCHGGGPDSFYHKIERVTQPTVRMSAIYARLMSSDQDLSPEQISNAIHPAPRRILTQAIEGCLDCHEELEEDESLQKQYALLDTIGEAERAYVKTASRLAAMGHGVLLTDAQQFTFQDARTHLIGLAPLQHTLDTDKVAEKVQAVRAVCDQVDAELDHLDAGLRWRHQLLIPIWIFAAVFAAALYAKFKQLKAIHVLPTPKGGH